jgi:hypothetical protein
MAYHQIGTKHMAYHQACIEHVTYVPLDLCQAYELSSEWYGIEHVSYH